MGETLTMSSIARERLDAMKRVERLEISLMAAGLQLGLSYRQAKRILARFREEGDRGVIHRSRGRPSNRGLPSAVRDRALALYREQLAGFGPTLASELLAERWDVHVGHETLRRWLIADGQWRSRGRPRKHRRRRMRKSHFGEMIQLDGSHHDWFGRGELDCLLGMIDDATNRRMTRMSSEETTADGLELLLAWVRRHGIPQSLYVDRKSVYWNDRPCTIDESLAGIEPATVFGRVCQKLGIRVVYANSPQAKGRIERCHAVYQDRLVKMIKLDGLKDHDQVNLLLESLDDQLNQKFSVPAAEDADMHRPIPRDLHLPDIFAQEYTRVINIDWTFRFENCWFQITGPKRSLPPAKGRIQVLRRLDRSLHAFYRGQNVQFEELEERPPKELPKKTTTPSKPKSRKPPAVDHPWRQPLFRNAPSLKRS